MISAETARQPPFPVWRFSVADYHRLDQDRDVKSRIYARAEIAIYWIVNLVESQIEVFTNPVTADSSPGYSSRQVFRGDDFVPLIIDASEIARIAANDLLP